MNPWKRCYILTVPVLLALVLSALAVRPAFADGVPPPSDTPSGVVAPSASPSDKAPSAQLASAPADDSARHVALARQQAAELVINGDPRWCPTGVVPRNGHGCSSGYPSLTALATGFTPTGNGTIWIEKGPTPGGITFGNGLFWTSQNMFSLTFQGGWNGHLGSTGLSKANPADPYPLSTLDSYLNVAGWVGKVTMKNLMINSAHGPYLADWWALYVTTQGDIVLRKVQVLSTDDSGIAVGNGALLNNTSGSGNVQVIQAVFNSNEGMGLLVRSNGGITLGTVVADMNGSTGADISNHLAPTPHPVSVATSEFNSNGGDGLHLLSDGMVTLTSLTANLNFNDGVHADNGLVPGTAFPLTMKGTNNFNFNNAYGLYGYSYGPIKVSRTNANGNSFDGVHLRNSISSFQMPITIVGYLTANANGSFGLDAISRGAVTATKLTANGNTSYGAHIDNMSALSGVPMPVTLLGVNTFNWNGIDGLRVVSVGDIKVSSVTASSNRNYGAYLDNTGSTAAARVTILGYGRFEYNGGAGSYDGLYVVSHGAVKLANLKANYNTQNGTYITVIGNAVVQPVTLTGSNQFTFNGQGGTSGFGLQILTDGKIAASNIRANSNFSGGAVLDNFTNWVLSPSSVLSPITLGGINTFNGNLGIGGDGHGLYANGNSAILLSHVTANSNALDGIFAQAISTFPVTVICSSARYNGESNLEIHPASKIILKGYVSFPPDEDDFGSIDVIRKPCP